MKTIGPKLVLAIGLLSLAACGEKSPEFSGVGKWRFTHSVLKDVHDGNCQPTDLNDGRKARRRARSSGTGCSGRRSSHYR